MTERNPALWNLLIVATVIVAATVTLMIFDRQDLTRHASDAHKEAKIESSAAKIVSNENADTATTDNIITETVIEKPEPEEPKLKQQPTIVTASDKTTASSGEYILVAASFRNEYHAQNFINAFKEKISWSNPEIISHSENDQIYFRIVALHGRSFKQIAANLDSLIAAGYFDAWIYRHQ